MSVPLVCAWCLWRSEGISPPRTGITDAGELVLPHRYLEWKSGLRKSSKYSKLLSQLARPQLRIGSYLVIKNDYFSSGLSGLSVQL